MVHGIYMYMYYMHEYIFLIVQYLSDFYLKLWQ